MIRRLDTKQVYQNPWMTVREDAVEFPNGHRGIYGVVEKPDFSLIIPYSDHGFYLVRQFRYPVGAAYWEFPQGTYTQAANPAEQAARELREETGLTARKMHEIGYLYEAYGYCDQGFHIFLASDLEQVGQQLEVTESDLQCRWFSEREFDELIDAGEIRDAPTVAAHGLLQRKLELIKQR